MSSKASPASTDARLQSLLAVHRYAPLPLFKTFESLAQIGHTNLSYLVRFLRRREGELSEELGIFKDVERALAQGPALFEHASEPRSAVMRFIRKPEVDSHGLPVLSVREDFKAGETTLRMCGWCEHRGSGSYSYDAMLYGDCTLQAAVGGEFDQEVRCADACHLAQWDAPRFEAALTRLRERIETAKARRDVLRDLSRQLRELREGVSELPALPAWRADTHFTSGGRVIVYTRPIGRHESLVEGVSPWVAGRIEGPVHGTAHVKTCTQVTTDGVDEGRHVTAGSTLPWILRLDEFWQLRSMALSKKAEDKFFLQCWLANAQDAARGFDAEAFLDDLRHGDVTQSPQVRQLTA